MKTKEQILATLSREMDRLANLKSDVELTLRNINAVYYELKACLESAQDEIDDLNREMVANMQEDKND